MSEESDVIRRTLTEMLLKLSNPHWMPQNPLHYISNLTPEHVGQLNLMWVISGRPEFSPRFFPDNLANWELAGRVSVQMIDNYQVREYATLFSEPEFYRFLKQHPQVFGRYLPMANWRKHFSRKSRHGV